MARNGWNDVVLRGVFIREFTEDLKDELAVWEESGDLKALISLITRLDNRLRERHRQKVRECPVRSSGNVSR